MQQLLQHPSIDELGVEATVIAGSCDEATMIPGFQKQPKAWFSKATMIPGFQKPYGNEHAVQHASFLVLNVQSMCPNALSSCNYKRAELESLVTDSREEAPVHFIAVTKNPVRG